MTAKKCTKKRDARTVVVLPIQPIFFDVLVVVAVVASKVRNRDLTKLRQRMQRARLKPNRCYEQNNNSARASRFFVHFFAVTAQLQHEMT